MVHSPPVSVRWQAPRSCREWNTGRAAPVRFIVRLPQGRRTLLKSGGVLRAQVTTAKSTISYRGPTPQRPRSKPWPENAAYVKLQQRCRYGRVRDSDHEKVDDIFGRPLHSLFSFWRQAAAEDKE